MPDVLLAPGSIKSLTDCKIGAGGVKDVIEIDIGVGGQVYKVWPSVVPYEDGTNLLKIGGIRYDGYIDDATGTAGSTSTSWGGSCQVSYDSDDNSIYNKIFWYAYPDVNVAQIDYLYCNYFYARHGNKDSTYKSRGTFYCSVANDPATNISKDTHKVSYYTHISTQNYFYWSIDMRNINTGILKLGYHVELIYGGTANVYLGGLYSYSVEPSLPDSRYYDVCSSTMT